MKLGIKREVEVDARILKICCKVRDEFCADLTAGDGTKLHGQDDGYVPHFMPGGGGDYLELDIDIENGRVLNWTAPTANQLRAWIEGK